MFQTIPIKKVSPSEGNYRKTFDPKGMEELTASVRAKGVLQPILVRPKGKGYEIVAGHRRYTAAKEAGLKELPAMVKDLSDEEALEVQVIENSQREDPNPMDEAWGFKRLLDMGKHTPETLAEKIDHSIAYVLGRIKLVDLDETVQNKIASGEIGLGHALLFTRLRGHEDQKVFLENVVDQDMSVAAAKNALQRYYSLGLTHAPFNTKTCGTCAYRSRNQTVLFPDIGKTDECTDRSCYFVKTRDHYKRLLDQKQDEGFQTFMDEKKMKKLIELNNKDSKPIVSSKDDADYYTVYPREYKTRCMKCKEHHAFYMLEDKDWSGNKTIKFGEICLDKKCLDKMQKQGKKKDEEADSNDGPRNYNSPYAAKACVRRSLGRAIIPLARRNPILILRAILYVMLPCADSAKPVLEKYLPELSNIDDWFDLTPYVSRIPEDKLEEVLQELTLSEFSCHEDIKYLSKDAGVDARESFTIDREWLETKGKEELVALAGELQLPPPAKLNGEALPHSFMNKEDLTDFILGFDLKGKVPAEIAAVIEADKDGECPVCGQDTGYCTCGDELSGEDFPEGEPPGEIEPEPGLSSTEASGEGETPDPTMPQPTKTKRKPRSRA